MVPTLCNIRFKYYHCVIIVHSTYFVIMMINGLTAPNGILRIISLQEVVTGCKLDFKKDCRALFEAYIEESTDATIANNMSPRTKGSLSFGPSVNLQGLLKFFDLDTGQVVVRRSFKVLHTVYCKINSRFY